MQILNTFYNFHWILPAEAARSAQPYMRFYGTLLEANGIRSVINLRGYHPPIGWWRYETRTCRRLGIAHFDAMLDSRKLPSRARLLDLVEAFDAAPRPFLIKCSGGQDRSSFAAAMYILHRGGWTMMPQALGQFARFPYLRFPKPEQLWVGHFLEHARLSAAGAPLAVWLRGGYDRDEFIAWLKARGQEASFRGLLD